jgi:hypothetical protein
VTRESFEDLDQAMSALKEAASKARAEGPLDSLKMLRNFEPGERVAARIEVSAGGWLRGREAGVDLMGDGRLVAYAGGRGRVRCRAARTRRLACAAMEQGEAEVPKGSEAVGRRVRLPRGAEPPIRVYVNGVEQQQGGDYEVRPGEIVFNRLIVKEKVGVGRWMAMYLGLFGTYRKHETIDVEYRLGGKVQLASDVEVLRD